MKYSVILPIYNKTTVSELERSINSILNQTYRNIELILICDGPIQNTVELYINHFKNKIKIIKLDDNYGPGYSRNIGVKYSIGDYIVIMDSDDYSVNNRIERANYIIKKTNAKIYCANITENNGYYERIKSSNIVFNRLNFKYLLNPINNVTMIIEKKFYEDNSGYSNIRYGEDFVFVAKSLLLKCNIYYDNFTAVNVFVDNQFYERRRNNLLKNEILLCNELVKIGYFNYYHFFARLTIRLLSTILPNKILFLIRKNQN